MTDIFDTPSWPSDKPCLIAGSGPNLLMAQPFDQNYYGVTVTLNKAQLKVGGDFWLCSAPGLLQQDWFKDHMKWWIKVILNGGAIWGSPVFMNGPLTAAYPEVPFTFNDGGDISIGEPCAHGVLKHGASVIGRAIQLAYLKGCKEIELAGVDMMGNEYYDNTVNKKRGPGPWASVGNVNMLIEWVGAHGCRVRSLTPTALTVEMMK